MNNKNTVLTFYLITAAGLLLTAFFVSAFFIRQNNPSPDILIEEDNENCSTGTASSVTSIMQIADVPIPEISVSGNPEAAVTIIEFSDFLCPYCKNAYEMLFSLPDEFKNNVKIIFVNYPLDRECNKKVKSAMHEGACLLAKGAICASLQNRFKEYSEAAFSVKMKNPDTAALRQLGILARTDLTEFTACLSRPDTAKILNDQIKTADALNITSIPSIFINGRYIENWSNSEQIIQTIRQELLKTGKQ